MTVDRLEPLDKQRSKVFVDGDFAFVLYRGEIRKYHIEEGAELAESLYEEILTDLLPKRARERALYYLQSQPRTEHEVVKKLRESFYPASAVEETVAFLKEYRYLDDTAYVRDYLEQNGGRKSRAELFQFLMRKGIPKDLMKEIYEEASHDSREVILEILKKKHFDRETASPEEKRKIAAYLNRRGFGYDDISECLT